MNVEEILTSLKTDGWCVLRDVVPNEKVDGIRQAVLAEVDWQHAEQERQLAAVRAKGHRISVSGVGYTRA